MNDEHSSPPSFPGDIWSFAAVLLHCLTGKAAFEGKRNQQALKALLQGQAPGPIPNDLPQPLQALLAQCFLLEPSDRPTLLELKQVTSVLVSTVCLPDFCGLYSLSAFEPLSLHLNL